MAKVFTSIAPHLRRFVGGHDVTDDYLRECFSSWHRAGFTLISINQAVECAALRARFPEVEYQTTESKIPTISDFLNAIRMNDSRLVGIANCDCVLRAPEHQIEWMRDQATRGVVMMERQNFSPMTLSATGIRCHGFDAFLFFREAADKVAGKVNPLRIGETWWDYEFPLAFVEAGFPLAHCTPLLHVDHQMGWDVQQWRNNAQATYRRFGQTLGGVGLRNATEPELHRFAQQCFYGLIERAERDESFEARMSDKLVQTILEHRHEVLEHRHEVEKTVEAKSKSDSEIEYLKGLLHSRSLPSMKRRRGELLCALASVARKGRLAPKVAEALRAKGVHLQREADEENLPKSSSAVTP